MQFEHLLAYRKKSICRHQSQKCHALWRFETNQILNSLWRLNIGGTREIGNKSPFRYCGAANKFGVYCFPAFQLWLQYQNEFLLLIASKCKTQLWRSTISQHQIRCLWWRQASSESCGIQTKHEDHGASTEVVSGSEIGDGSKRTTSICSCWQNSD